jgi:hypothetical protein
MDSAQLRIVFGTFFVRFEPKWKPFWDQVTFMYVFLWYFFTGIFISKSDYEMRLRHHINEANWLSSSWLNWCNLKLDTAYLQKLFLKFVSLEKYRYLFERKPIIWLTWSHHTALHHAIFGSFLWACILAVFFSKQALRLASQKLRL